METRQLERTDELLKRAQERADFPKIWREVRYFDEVDLLVIRFLPSPATYSKDNIGKGLVYNYDANDNLVSLEILDLYGIYASA